MNIDLVNHIAATIRRVRTDSIQPYTYDRATGRAIYRFANDYTVSVIPDPHVALRFEVLLSHAGEVTVTNGPLPNGIAPDLTSEDVERLLEQVEQWAKEN